MRPRISPADQDSFHSWNKPRLTVVSCLHLSLSLSYMCLTPFSQSLATGFTSFGVAWEGQDLNRGTLQKGIQIHLLGACYRAEPDVCAHRLISALRCCCQWWDTWLLPVHSTAQFFLAEMSSISYLTSTAAAFWPVQAPIDCSLGCSG